jgi:acid stress-induced BolA-like protein IbaG/YrbA
MAKLTKDGLAKLLTHRLNLRDPEFRLEKAGDRLVGNVISESFKGKRDYQRQRLIWDALEEEFGDQAVLRVGLLLAYTPDEWKLGSEEEPVQVKAKKAG